jgi:hypothetical protein
MIDKIPDTLYSIKKANPLDLATETLDASICGKCEVELFDDYYVIKKSGKYANVCKFCMHYGYVFANNYSVDNVYRAKSKTTVGQLINTIIEDDDEKKLLFMILKAIKEKTIKCRRETESNIEVVEFDNCVGRNTYTVNPHEYNNIKYVFRFYERI